MLLIATILLMVAWGYRSDDMTFNSLLILAGLSTFSAIIAFMYDDQVFGKNE